jgi:hypothetical protein
VIRYAPPRRHIVSPCQRAGRRTSELALTTLAEVITGWIAEVHKGYVILASMIQGVGGSGYRGWWCPVSGLVSGSSFRRVSRAARCARGSTGLTRAGAVLLPASLRWPMLVS